MLYGEIERFSTDFSLWRVNLPNEIAFPPPSGSWLPYVVRRSSPRAPNAARTDAHVSRCTQVHGNGKLDSDGNYDSEDSNCSSGGSIRVTDSRAAATTPGVASPGGGGGHHGGGSQTPSAVLHSSVTPATLPLPTPPTTDWWAHGITTVPPSAPSTLATISKTHPLSCIWPKTLFFFFGRRTNLRTSVSPIDRVKTRSS